MKYFGIVNPIGAIVVRARTAGLRLGKKTGKRDLNTRKQGVQEKREKSVNEASYQIVQVSVSRFHDSI